MSFVPRISPASMEDVPVVWALIRELADYEHLAHTMAETEADIRAALFGQPQLAHAIIARCDGEPVGLGVFYFNLSTFRGRPGLYIEDLYVKPAARGRGIGRALLAHIAQTAVRRGCDRLEWASLDWNESAHRFYERLGAQRRKEWILFRLAGGGLENLARESGSAALPNDQSG